MKLRQDWEDRIQGIIRTGKFFAIDGLATSAISSREIAALKHEVRDDTMETGSLVAISVLAGG